MKNFSKSFKRGFTLIELLVVVAIVGILAAITLGYLSSAKSRGEETAVKSNLATARTAIEMFFLNNGNTYLPSGHSSVAGTTCPTYNDGTINMFSLNKDIAGSIAEAVKRGDYGSYCYNSDAKWAVAVGLKLATNKSWCIDVSGTAKLVNYLPSNAVDPITNLCK